MKQWIIGIAVVLIFPVLVSAAAVVNGGFETGNFSGWVQSGDTACTYVLSAGTDLLSTPCVFGGSYAATTHSGTYAAYMGPGGDGFLTQTLSTVPGATYTLDFWLASLENAGVGNIPNNFHVSWNGTEIFSATDMDVFDFTQYTFGGLVATGATTELVIGGFANPRSYFALDDVSVSSSVPEPASALLIGGALLMLGAWARKRAAGRS